MRKPAELADAQAPSPISGERNLVAYAGTRQEFVRCFEPKYMFQYFSLGVSRQFIP